jgi:hypothetical protein
MRLVAQRNVALEASVDMEMLNNVNMKKFSYDLRRRRRGIYLSAVAGAGRLAL